MRPRGLTARTYYRAFLTRQIEIHAVENRLTFNTAAKEVTTRSDMFEAVTMSMGNHWKAAPLTNAMIRGLRDKAKLDLAKLFPNLSDEQLIEAAPYLKVKQRPKALLNAKKAREYLKGCKTYEFAAYRLGVSIQTVYRRAPVHGDRTWEAKALELLQSPQKPSISEIARALNVSYRKVRYFLQAKGKGAKADNT
ncbi:hypothetical protein [Marivita sp.]|uniref:hypothetical protein n=1 Tax=Marivita sp. TaxID=2003365 RepID=UPI003F705EA5